jgi:hypothetical protein
MRRVLAAAGLVWLLQGAGATSIGTTSLEYQRGVELVSGASQQYFVVDGTIWEHARTDLSDVRLYSAGTEVPYVLQTGAGSVVREQVDCNVLQPAMVAGNTQFVLDMTQTELYSTVHVDLKTKDFVAHARIEGANDVHAKEWALLGTSTLYDFTSENLGHNSTLRMPNATFRYLRVTLDGPIKPDDVTGAKTGVGRDEATRWVTVAEHPAITQQGRDTVLSFSLPTKIPVERIQFDVDSGEANFVRSVEIRSEVPGEVLGGDAKEKIERSVGTGTITKIHMQRGGKKIDQEDSSVPVFAQGQGTLKIIVHNGDDQPLKINGAQLEQVERRIYFQSPAASQVTLYYGNERLAAPNYDYGKLFQMDPSAAESRLLAEAMNAAYRKPPDSRPWSERHPAAMWAALIGAIVVLGAVALRSLRAATA